jgi:predicted ATP-grasp superfamily ATP-dependent carboligase
LRRWAAGAADRDALVVQPYLPGQAASLSLLCSTGRAMVLSCNLQDVRLDDGQFHYRGGTVGGAEERRAAYMPIADAVAAAIPGLWGYVGVDLIDTAGGPVVLEINPRLTTSYAGLGDALGGNPAALVLQLLTREIAEIAVPRPPRRHRVRVDGHAA